MFSTQNDAYSNMQALNEMLSRGGRIVIDTPGVYDICAGAVIHSDTELIFVPGVILNRVHSENEGAYLLINEGAYTRKFDKNITVRGMHFNVNGIAAERKSELFIQGLIAQVGFSYVKNLTVEDFTCTDVEKMSFCLQICTFENITVRNAHIEGMKDGIHLGRGNGFCLKDCVFRTYDDPIALNADDYSTSNPQTGVIENGVIENCTELEQAQTTGYFCRMLGGAFVEWYEGMQVQNSDKVNVGNALYGVVAKPDGTVYTSGFKPSHARGLKEYGDGIVWNAMQDDGAVFSAFCKNITFRNIKLDKTRQVGFALSYSRDNWHRTCYPGCTPQAYDDIIIENAENLKDMEYFLWSIVPINNITFRNCRINRSKVHFAVLDEVADHYTEVHITFDNCEFTGSGEQVILSNDIRLKVTAVFTGTHLSGGIVPRLDGNIRIASSDITFD